MWLTCSAHYVSNRSTSTSQAICALQAHARWAVTGTPIQNRLSDLATICQFLRVYPYDNPKTFDADITQVWKAGSSDLALTRLKRLLRYILLRRATGIIDLPPRRDLKITVQLSREEQERYKAVESTVVNNLDAVLSASGSSQATYQNVLHQINELRLICNLGVHRAFSKSHAPAPTMCQPAIAQGVWQTPIRQGKILCWSCFGEIDSIGDAPTNGYSADPYSQRPQMFSCLRVLCTGCLSLNDGLFCGHYPPCAPIPTNFPISSQSHISSQVDERATDEVPLSTKVKALVEDLLGVPQQTKR